MSDSEDSNTNPRTSGQNQFNNESGMKERPALAVEVNFGMT